MTLQRVRQLKPHVIQGWMYHGNCAAAFLRLLVCRNTSLIFNVRQSLPDIRREKLLTRCAIRVGAILSRYAECITYNAESSQRDHSLIGYESKRNSVLVNGFDLTRFRPNPISRRRFREALGVNDKSILIGIVARFHPVKDHFTFLRSARLIFQDVPSARFALVGRGCDRNNKQLSDWVDELGLSEYTYFCGECKNLEDVYPAFDILCLNSIAEGFPNVLGEAMACGVHCVSTDVGAASAIVDDRSRIVPIRNESAMAHAVLDLIKRNGYSSEIEKKALRQRIYARFDLAKVAADYDQLLWAAVDDFSSRLRSRQR
jgi:glycosyltransferase involved in cell wall biosynthesis